MATKTMNISLTPELREAVEHRVHSGLYGNASDVVRAGLRALAREEMAADLKRFDEIMAQLPQDPITPEIERRIEQSLRRSRAAGGRKRAARK
ncbi:MAG: type II toxin-antitoxin system ParD family antitoxin [Limisphaerales bacterium]